MLGYGIGYKILHGNLMRSLSTGKIICYADKQYIAMPFVRIGVADIRTMPKFESERDSQVVYGEKLEILENLGEYTKVKSVDGVIGYVKTFLLTEGDARKYKLLKFFDAGSVKLPFGSLLSEEDVERLSIPESRYVSLSDNSFSVPELAMKFIGVPYLWGGGSDFGFDCSGFVQRLYRFIGLEIPRNSDQQRDFTETIEDFDHSTAGDLIFFKGHVALHLGNGKIIHANGHSASVSVDNLFDGSAYSHHLMGIFEKIGRVTRSL